MNAERLGLSDVCEFRQATCWNRCATSMRPCDRRRLGHPDDLAAVTGWFQDALPVAPPAPSFRASCWRRSVTRSSPGGRLYLPTGTLQDENAILAAARRVFGDNIEPVLERTFPLPDLVAKATATARLMKDGLLKLHQRGSRLLWSPASGAACALTRPGGRSAVTAACASRRSTTRAAPRQGSNNSPYTSEAPDDHAQHEEQGQAVAIGNDSPTRPRTTKDPHRGRRRRERSRRSVPDPPHGHDGRHEEPGRRRPPIPASGRSRRSRARARRPSTPTGTAVRSSCGPLRGRGWRAGHGLGLLHAKAGRSDRMRGSEEKCAQVAVRWSPTRSENPPHGSSPAGVRRR